MDSIVRQPTSKFLEALPIAGAEALPDRVFPAPMEGVLTPLFCHAMASKGWVRAWISPFYRVANGGVPRVKKLQREIAFLQETGLPIVVQLMGTDPDLIAEVAQRFMEFEGVVGINFNFACPSKRVLLRGGGGACMRTPEVMKSIVEKTSKALPGVSISAKTRTGFSDPRECEVILPMLRDLGCDFVAVHHRTVEEAYSKVTNREERLLKAKQALGEVPLLASGDIFGVDDVLRLEQSGCCEGVMIARGLIRKPLLLSEVRQALADPDRQHEGDKRQREQAFDFIDHALQLCCDDPDRYWNYKFVMELSKSLFGVRDPVFRKLIEFNEASGPKLIKETLFEMRDEPDLREA